MASNSDSKCVPGEDDEPTTAVLPESKISNSFAFRPSLLNANSMQARPFILDGSNSVVSVNEATPTKPETNRKRQAPEPNTSILPKIDQATTSQSSGFVFGQNISSRTTNSGESVGQTENLWGDSSSGNSSDELFTQLAAKAAKKDSNSTVVGKSLQESAEETFKSQQLNVNLDEKIDLETGEENETTVFQGSCRLFVLEEMNKWNSLGSAYLHLNDPKDDSDEQQRSRLIARMTSTLRLVINTPIYREMSVQLASSKAVRIGIINEDQKTKIYLMVLPGDFVDEFYSELVTRVNCAHSSKHQLDEESSSQVADAEPSPRLSDDEESGNEREQEEQEVNEDDSLNASSLSPKVNQETQQQQQPKSFVFRQSRLADTVRNLDSNRTRDESSSSGAKAQQSPPRVIAGLKRGPQDEPTSPKPILTANPLAANVSHHVFGQNLHNRVANIKAGSSSIAAEAAHENPCELFTQLARKVCRREDDFLSVNNNNNSVDNDMASTAIDSISNGHENGGETLEQAAARFQASKELHLRPPSLADAQEKPCSTGEEQEQMAIRTYCQVFFLNREKKTWEGRGHVYLHVNDSTDGRRSRLVARMQRTHRLILNSPIWSSMKMEMSNDKSIRCLIMNSGVDAPDSTEVAAAADGTSNGSSSMPNGCLIVFKNPNEAQRLFEVLRERIERKRPFDEEQ